MVEQIKDLTVTCYVDPEDVEECVVRLRHGERLPHIPEGYVCMDAFQGTTTDSSGKATIIARYSMCT